MPGVVPQGLLHPSFEGQKTCGIHLPGGNINNSFNGDMKAQRE